MSTSIFLTELDYKRLGKKLLELSQGMKALEEEAAKTISSGARKEVDVQHEQMSSLLSCKSARLREIREILYTAEVIPMPTGTEKVVLGTKVTILRDGDTQVWEVVGFGQSEFDERKIAYNTPLAQHLIGKRVGDEFDVTIVSKTTKIRIVAIEVANGNGKLGH